MLRVLRMIKLFAWESKTLEQLDEKRRRELKLVMKNRLLQLAMFNIGAMLPTISMVAALATYVSFDSYSQTEHVEFIVFHGRRSS